MPVDREEFPLNGSTAQLRGNKLKSIQRESTLRKTMRIYPELKR
jgi:hypothetical protein